MGQDAFFQILREIAMADSTAYWLVGALTCIAFVVMRSMLPVKGLSIVLAPVVFWGGLSGIYALSMLGVFFSTDKSSNIVLSAAIGMVAALILAILVLRVLQAIVRIRKPLTRTADVPTLEPRRVRI